MKRFLIVVGYHRGINQTHFSHSGFDLELRVREPVNGTGSAALLGRELAGAEPFLPTFGDILRSPAEDTRAMQTLDSGTQPVTAVADPWQGAAIYEEQGRILKITGKPPMGTSRTHWNSAGVCCFRAAVFGYLEQLKPSVRNEYELTPALDAMLADGLVLRTSPVEGEWRDAGRPEDLADLNQKAGFFRVPSGRE